MPYYIRLPDNSYVAVPDDVPEDQAMREINLDPRFRPIIEQSFEKEKNLLRDIPGYLVRGVGQVPTAVGSLINVVPGMEQNIVGRGLRAAGEAISGAGTSILSPGTQRQQALFDLAMQEAENQGLTDQAKTALAEAIRNPRIAAGIAIESLPSLVGSFGAGLATRAAAGVASRVAGRQLTEQAGRRAAIAGAVGSESLLEGGGSADEVYRSIMALPEEQLQRSPEYQELLKQGLNPDEAKERLAVSAARQAAAQTAAISGTVGAAIPGAESAMFRPLTQRGVVGRSLGVAAPEMVQEAGQEGGAALSENIARQRAEVDRELLAGVGSRATLGAIVGGLTGAGVGAIRGGPGPEIDRTEDAELRNILNEYVNVRGEAPAVPPTVSERDAEIAAFVASNLPVSEEQFLSMPPAAQARVSAIARNRADRAAASEQEKGFRQETEIRAGQEAVAPSLKEDQVGEPGVAPEMPAFEFPADVKQALQDIRGGIKPPERKSLMQFLRTLKYEAQGLGPGISDVNYGNEVKNILGNTKRIPGLINDKKGVPLDRARELAVESGYLPEGADINDLLNAIMQEDREGVRNYGNSVRPEAQLEYEERVRNAQELERTLYEAGVDIDRPDSEIAAALGLEFPTKPRTLEDVEAESRARFAGVPPKELGPAEEYSRRKARKKEEKPRGPIGATTPMKVSIPEAFQAGQQEQTPEQVQAQAEQAEQAAKQRETNEARRAEILQRLNNEYLAKLEAKGPQGKRAADAVRKSLEDRTLTAEQLYGAFKGAEIITDTLPAKADHEIEFVKHLTDASGQEVQGKRMEVKDSSAAGIIKLSLSESQLPLLSETASHEAFHVLQDYYGKYDPDFRKLMKQSFRDGMTINDVDSTIKRKLQTIRMPNGEQSYWDALVQSLPDQKLSAREAEAYVFGSLAEAARRGVPMTGMKPAFTRFVNFLTKFFRRMKSAIRGDGFNSPDDVLGRVVRGDAARFAGEAAPEFRGSESSARLPQSIIESANVKLESEGGLKGALQRAEFGILTSEETARYSRTSSPEGIEYKKNLDDRRVAWSKMDWRRKTIEDYSEKLREPNLTDDGIFKIQKRIQNARMKYREAVMEAELVGLGEFDPFPTDIRFTAKIGEFPGDEKYMYRSYAPEGFPFASLQHDYHNPAYRMPERGAASEEYSARAPMGSESSARLPPTINVDGVQRSTTNSEGRPIHPTEEGVRNFWRWFGDSKIIDTAGKPRVMYHGTSGESVGAGGITQFDPKKSGGFLFAAPTSAMASSFAGADRGKKSARKPTVYPVYVKAENPFDYENYDHVAAVAQEIDYGSPVGGRNSFVWQKEADPESMERFLYGEDNWKAIEDGEVQRAIGALGFDGFFVDENSKNIGVYGGNQFKSAIANTGAFSQEDARIDYSARLPPGSATYQAAAQKINGDRLKQNSVLKRGIDALVGARAEYTYLYSGKKEAVKGKTSLALNMVNRAHPAHLLDNLLRLKGKPQMADVGRAWESAMNNDGRIARMVEAGGYKYDKKQGIPVIDKAVKSLGDIFMGRVKAEESDAAQRYFVALRERDLRKQGRQGFTNISDNEINEIIKYSETNRPEWKNVAKDYDAWNKGLVQFLVDTDVIKQDVANELGNAFYTPFYRLLEEDGKTNPDEVIGPSTAAAMKNPSDALKKLGGGEQQLGNLFENIIRNADAIVRSGLKNVAMQKTVTAMEAAGLAKKVPTKVTGAKNIATIRKGGDNVYYQIDDPLMMIAISTMPETMQNGILQAMASVGGFIRDMITSAPSFMLANLWRGKVVSYVQEGVPLTKSTALSLRDALKQTASFGAIQDVTGFGGLTYGMGSRDVASEFQRQLRMKDGSGSIMDRVKGIIVGLQRFSEATEMAERMKLTEYHLSKGKSLNEAAWEGYAMAPFSRRGMGQGLVGNAVSLLAPLVPFLNARIQGNYRLIEKASPAMFGKQLLLRGMVLMAFSLGMAMLASDDERWDRETPDRKFLYDIFYVGDRQILLPRAFEVGTLFGALPVFAFDAARKQSGEDLGRALGLTLMSTFGFTPIPAAVAPAFEVVTNYDWFLGRELESAGIRSRPVSERVQPGTTEAAKLTSAAINETLGNLPRGLKVELSPIQAQALLEGYLGTTGMMVLSAIDGLLGWTGATPKKPAGPLGDPNSPVGIAATLSGMKRFVKGDEERVDRFVGDFYDLKREVTQWTAALSDAANAGNLDRVREIQEERGSTLGMRNAVNQVGRAVAQVSRRMKAIYDNEEMSAEEKAAALAPLREQRNRLTERIMQLAREQGVR